MKFDKIIMNPPYSRNLHLKILAEAIKHLSDDGTCVNLSPIRWLQDPLAKYKKNSDYKKFEESVAKHIDDCEQCEKRKTQDIFGINLEANIGIYRFINAEGKFNYSSMRSFRGFMPDDYFDKIQAKHLKSLDDVTIKNKDRKLKNYVFINAIDGFVPIGIPATHCVRLRYKYFQNDLSNGKTAEELKKTSGSAWGKLEEWACVEFNTGTEAKNFYEACESTFYRFLCYAFTIDQNVPTNFLPWMGDAVNPRTGKKGYESEWTNEDFYAYFGITDEEWKLIEETMEKYR